MSSFERIQAIFFRILYVICLNLCRNCRYLRYPKDPFDRIWYQYTLSSANAVSNTTTLEIDPNSNPYKVPIGVLENAQVLNDSRGWEIQSNLTDNWYIYLYFTEIQDLKQNQSREFSVYVDNVVVATESLQLSKMTAFKSQMITGQTTITFGLSPTAQSTLSPILNAFETFKVLDLPNPMTAPGDCKFAWSLFTTIKSFRPCCDVLSWKIMQSMPSTM